ncbi:MAG: ornithine carbamoyltransferase [Spirochaetes bacterium]|nr:ornithine carbamoyltransferase [Spirochaetota bacterium]
MKQLNTKDLLSVVDLSEDEIFRIFTLAGQLKKKNKKLLKDKTLGMIFEKSSTRTRVSFEVGMFQLGGYALFLSKNDIQLNRGETIRDTARVLSRYLDGIMVRAYSHDSVSELAHSSSIPVINGLTDLLHPCQALSDFFTISEYKKDFKQLKLGFIGDGNNVAHSLLLTAALLGTDITIASPEGYTVSEDIVAQAKDLASKSGSQIVLTAVPEEAAKDADVLYTDVWVSMGQEKEEDAKLKIFKDYRIDSAVLAKAKPDALVMHCLPAHRGEEITNDVIEGSHSVVFCEAENRLHTQKAIMALLMA